MLGATLHLLLKTHVVLIKSAFPIYAICTLSELRFLHIAPLHHPLTPIRFQLLLIPLDAGFKGALALITVNFCVIFDLNLQYLIKIIILLPTTHWY